VWLATEDGLVRYDGHELFRYAYSRNARGGLPRNYIQTIVEDRHHDLWIAVKDGGLAAGNARPTASPSTATIPTMPARSPATPCTPCWWMPAIRVWIGTSNAGLDVLDPASGRIEHLRHDPNNPNSLSDDRIFTLALDRSGVLWVGTEVGSTAGNRAARVHPSSSRARNPRSLSGNQVSRVLEDQSGASGSAPSMEVSTGWTVKAR